MDSERINHLKIAEKAMKGVLSKTEVSSIYCPTIVGILLKINGLIRIEGKEEVDNDCIREVCSFH